MQEEREHLIRKVFPEIRTLCRQRGVTFTEIDLRWGLTEEEAVLGRVIRTCLEEIDRCRPHFIGMVGDRYGWVPEYHEIAMDPELGLRYPWIEQLALEGRSVTEIEFVHGVFDHPGIDDNAVHFYRRNDSTPQPEDVEQLSQLVDRIVQSPYPLAGYTDIEELGERVRTDLLATIDRIWPEEEAPDEFTLETRAHAAFAQSRRRAYIPNPQHLRQFTAWSKSDGLPMVLSGASGLGKSALGAFLAETFRRTNERALVIEHYVGASESSGRSSDVMGHIIRAICNAFDIDEEVPETPEGLFQAFPGWLFRLEHLAATQKRPTLILIDALDRLDPASQHLDWLPAHLPEKICILCSTTPTQPLDQLQEREIIELKVVPLEEERLRQSIVIRYLGEFHKGIAPARLARITADEKAGSPLFLRLVAEELRLHGDHETLDDEIDRLLAPDDLVGTFDALLMRLEEDFGRVPVRTVCSLIALSKTGLSESEILGASGLSRLELSQLLPALDFHLVRSDGLLSYHDNVLLTAVNRRYLGNDEKRADPRRSIVDHLITQPVDRRTLYELLPQLEELDDDERTAQLLGSRELFFFIADSNLEHTVLSAWQRCGGLQQMIAPYRSIIDRESDDIAITLEKQWNGSPVAPEQIDDTELRERLDRIPSLVTPFVEAGHSIVALEAYHAIRDRLGTFLPENGMLVQRTSYGIAREYSQNGENELAVQEIEQMLGIAEKHGDTTSALFVDMLSVHAVVLYSRNRYDEAEAVNRRIVAMDSTPKIEHRRINAMSNIAVICAQTDRVDEAESLLGEVLRYRRARYGSGHPTAVEVLNNLAALQFEKGKIDEAIEYLDEVITARRRIFGLEHPMTIRALGNLAMIRQEQERFVEAAEIFDEIIPAAERIYGESHPDLVQLLTPLSGVYISLGRSEEALIVSDRTMAIVEHYFAEDEQIRGGAHMERARALHALGRRNEAIEILIVLLDRLVASGEKGRPYLEKVQELLASFQN